jgi:cytochrome c biogenesis protein CcmG/thiol:disulfide interchange protein DsbE
MKRDRALVLALLLLLFAAVTFIAQRLGEPSAGNITPIAARKPMPALKLADTAGQPWTVGQHRGQVILINFWATWCGPCLQETPGLVSLAQARLAQTPALKNLAILGISLDAGGDTPANQAKVAAFASRFHVNYPLAFPPTGSHMEFGVEGIPTTILVDRQGRIAKTYMGAVRHQVFQADIQQLQSEP